MSSVPYEPWYVQRARLAQKIHKPQQELEFDHMDRRFFYCYLRDKKDSTHLSTREIRVRALNYCEAEALVAEHLNDDEYVQRIEQELDANEVT